MTLKVTPLHGETIGELLRRMHREAQMHGGVVRSVHSGIRLRIRAKDDLAVVRKRYEQEYFRRHGR